MSASHPSHPSHHYSLVRVLSVLSQAWTNFVYSISISEGMVEAKVGAGAGAGAGSGHSSVSEEERIELIPADLRRMTFLLGQRPSEESGESDKAKGIGISKEGSKGVDERLDRKKYSKYQLVNLIDPPFFTPPVSSYATVEEGSDDDLEVSDQVGVLFPLPEAIKDGEIDFPHVRLARSINHESLSSSYSVEARLRFDPQAGCKLLVLTDTLESRLLTQVCARDLARRLSLSEEMGIMVYLPPQYREYAIADREYDQSVALLPGSSGYQHALGRFLVLEKLDFAELTKEDVENLELVGLIKLLSGETCEAFLNTVIQKGWIKFLEPADVKELIAICRSKELLLRVLESGHRDFSRTIFWGDFSGIDFTLYEGLIFSEVDFSCAVLTGSRLQNSILTRADFFDFRSSAWVHQARSIDLPELLSASQKREIWDETWGKLLANPKARQKFVAYCEETHSTANFDLSVPGAKAFLSELVKDEKWGLVRLFLDRGLCLEPEEALQVFEA